MADYDRYSNRETNRDGDRERRWRERNRFSEARLDDRTGYEPGSSGGYRADRYYQGRTDYGRDDDQGSTYGGYEDRSFGERGSYSGATDPYGYDRSPYRSESAREYQTNRDPGMRGNYASEGFGGRYRSGERNRQSYDFNPYQGYGGIGPNFGFGHDINPSEEMRGREPHRGFIERAADRVSSWFGDDEAKERLRGDHAGRGPKGYKRSDDRIREDVSDRLADDSWLDASDIEVLVADCEVTLVGTVPDRESKRRAERLAEDISGVKHLQNNLRVSQLNRGTEEGTVANTTLNKQAAGRA